MTKKITVAVVLGGQSVEHPVSCASGAAVLEALNSDNFTVVPIGITDSGRWVSVDPEPPSSKQSMRMKLTVWGFVDVVATYSRVFNLKQLQSKRSRRFKTAMPNLVSRAFTYTAKGGGRSWHASVSE